MAVQPDSYEFAEPLDILPQLPKDFEAALAQPKWSDRKAALTALKDLAAYPRLAPGDFADVNRELKKIINKDSNIQVVAEAINCTANLAKGLRKEYSGPARTLCPGGCPRGRELVCSAVECCCSSRASMAWDMFIIMPYRDVGQKWRRGTGVATASQFEKVAHCVTHRLHHALQECVASG
jgi:hypothetical protein